MASGKNQSKNVNSKAQKKSSAKSGKLLNYSASRAKIIKVLQLLIFIITSIIIFYPPFIRGLFFETNVLWTEIAVFTLLIAYSILKIMLKEKFELKTHLDFASLAFVAVYALSIITAAYHRDAVAEWLKYCMYFALFLMLSDMLRSEKDRIRVMWVIAFSGTGVALFGIDGVTGSHVAGILNKVFRAIGYKYDMFSKLFTGRANSTMQYSNATGGYLIAIFFVLLGLTILSRKWWQRALAGAMSFIVLETFILTLSRGAYLAMAAAAVLFIIVLPKEQRGKGIVYGLLQFLIAGAAYIKLSGLIAGEYLRMTAVTVLIAAAAAGLLTLAAGKLGDVLAKLRLRTFAISVAALAVLLTAAVLLASTFTEPFTMEHGTDEADKSQSITRSVQLKPGNYIITFDITAANALDKPYACSFSVLSRSRDDILFSGYTRLINEKISDTDGIQVITREIKVPEDSKLVDIGFSSYYQGTSAAIENVQIKQADTGKVIKDVVLNYRFIPKSIVARMSNLFTNNSTYLRAIFYKDALRVFSHHPVLGVGGGGWQWSYNRYQSFEYWSTLPHSFWIQVIVEAGIFGAILLLYFLFGLMFQFIKIRKGNKITDSDSIIAAVAGTAAVGILGHSMVDFDMSLTAIFLLLWQLVAIINSIYRNQNTSSEIKTGKPFRLKIHAGIALVLACITLLSPIAYKSAEIKGLRAVEKYSEGAQQEGIDGMKEAVETDSKNTKYRVSLANMIISRAYNEEELSTATSYADSAYFLANDNAAILSELYKFYFTSGSVASALQVANRIIELRPFWPDAWYAKANLLYTASLILFTQKEDKSALEYVDKLIALINEAKEINENNMDPARFNEDTMKLVEKAQYIRDNYKEGESIKIDDVNFYSVPGMDVNLDKVPDQWNIGTQEFMKLSEEDGVISVENIDSGKAGYIESRKLSLNANSKYMITVELEKAEGIELPESLVVEIPGNIGKTTLEGNGGIYTAMLETKDKVNPSYGIRIYCGNELYIHKIQLESLSQD